ncbi:DUF4169 family protein [Novosphingobium sp. SL115]|uniref:DUF4169 family protein n=1 Tax=Novosphingobium sp. SL115 TaxID=2995150 RepID=UPI002274085F|nr:DUF4169 family protein [Novosphingobium sp. SL115]MCY1671319.1 DUF4169 family protein [Novosphingobium sp. SL115]
MGEVVNLRMARKARTRAGQQIEAQANRAKFGRTKGEKVRDAAEAERMARLIDGARRDEP